jgi:hypothetical protein
MIQGTKKRGRLSLTYCFERKAHSSSTFVGAQEIITLTGYLTKKVISIDLFIFCKDAVLPALLSLRVSPY